jgi:hypothetical protein
MKPAIAPDRLCALRSNRLNSVGITLPAAARIPESRIAALARFAAFGGGVSCNEVTVILEIAYELSILVVA